MAEAKPKKVEAGMISDVAKPGKTAASATSRPLIATGQPAAEDPMLQAPAATAAPQYSTKMRLEPLPHDEPASEEPAMSASDKADSDKPDRPAGAAESFDAVDTKPDTIADVEAAKARHQAEQTELVDHLIESRQYFLPINQNQRRRTKQLVWLALALAVVIGLAWTYLLLDAGIITIPGVSVPTHFLK